MFLRKALVVLALAIASLASTDANPNPDSDVTIVSFICSHPLAGVPALQVSDFHGQSTETRSIRATSQALDEGATRWEFSLAPGDWSVRICDEADGQFTVLAGQSRHLVFPLSAGIQLGPSCSVAGILPVGGLSVRLIGAGGKDLPVSVDGNAYYSQTFGRGRYTLEIGLMQRAKVDIPLDYSDQKPGEFCDKKIVRNVTLDDLRTAR